jgi:beta-lactamase superfamily II metal-dependent hydrolase
LRPEHRDADRILKACEDAKLKQIDYLVTTHFHSDHFGAILEVSQRIPVKCFMDKGTRAPAGDGDNRWSKDLYSLYEQATKGNVKTIRAATTSAQERPGGRTAWSSCTASLTRRSRASTPISTAVDGLK